MVIPRYGLNIDDIRDLHIWALRGVWQLLMPPCGLSSSPCMAFQTACTYGGPDMLKGLSFFILIFSGWTYWGRFYLSAWTYVVINFWRQGFPYMDKKGTIAPYLGVKRDNDMQVKGSPYTGISALLMYELISIRGSGECACLWCHVVLVWCHSPGHSIKAAFTEH